MYVREGNLTWQDEFDGIELDAASQEEAGEGILGLDYWWQHEEVGRFSSPAHGRPDLVGSMIGRAC